MLVFKAAGVRRYDFGGWYAGSADIERLHINRFKEGFGGHVIGYFTCELGVTLLGKSVLKLDQLRRSSVY